MRTNRQTKADSFPVNILKMHIVLIYALPDGKLKIGTGRTIDGFTPVCLFLHKLLFFSFFLYKDVFKVCSSQPLSLPQNLWLLFDSWQIHHRTPVCQICTAVWVTHAPSAIQTKCPCQLLYSGRVGGCMCGDFFLPFVLIIVLCSHFVYKVTIVVVINVLAIQKLALYFASPCLAVYNL